MQSEFGLDLFAKVLLGTGTVVSSSSCSLFKELRILKFDETPAQAQHHFFCTFILKVQ
jgi:hypothetical protein